MTVSLLITFRETLETSLVVGIVLAYLAAVGERRRNPAVWLGVAAGVLLSIILAGMLYLFVGGLEGPAENIYEGITMLLAAGLLSWMILWMLKQGRAMRREIETQVDRHVKNDYALGIFLLVLVSTLREGTETVIFLQAAILNAKAGAYLIGALLGIIIAVALAYGLFKGFSLVPIRTVFNVSSVLLILFAAGLIAHGIHELQEIGWFPSIIEHVWDLNPPQLASGAYPLLHEKGTIGSILVGLFGYNGNPSLLELIAYACYLFFAGFVWWRIRRKHA